MKIKEYNNLFNYLLCITFFIVMAYIGSKTHHRSFTHSVLGLFTYTAILSYAFDKNVTTPLFLGYLSHITIDLLNKKGLTILYPLKNRFCFNFCESSGTINKFLFLLFSTVDFIILILIGVKLK